jgi:hypothetical protein
VTRQGSNPATPEYESRASPVSQPARFLENYFWIIFLNFVVGVMSFSLRAVKYSRV